MARFGRPMPAMVKLDGTHVTEADQAVEAELRARIRALHPGHAILGEEDGGAIDPAVPTWVIDPIDATSNYMRGIPVFATLIGVVIDGRSVVGVASAPALRERWSAAQGSGATRNDVPVSVSAIDELTQAQVLHGGLDWYRQVPALWELLGSLADIAARTRGFGDFWNHLLVAGGMAEVAFERDLKPWDVAALECIVTEAGGRLTSFRGGSALTDGDVLTTNGLLHDRLIRLLAQTG
jgi:histidinol-phosphatase